MAKTVVSGRKKGHMSSVSADNFELKGSLSPIDSIAAQSMESIWFNDQAEDPRNHQFEREAANRWLNMLLSKDLERRGEY